LIPCQVWSSVYQFKQEEMAGDQISLKERLSALRRNNVESLTKLIRKKEADCRKLKQLEDEQKQLEEEVQEMERTLQKLLKQKAYHMRMLEELSLRRSLE